MFHTKDYPNIDITNFLYHEMKMIVLDTHMATDDPYIQAHTNTVSTRTIMNFENFKAIFLIYKATHVREHMVDAMSKMHQRTYNDK
jgi:hypothetical protein